MMSDEEVRAIVRKHIATQVGEDRDPPGDDQQLFYRYESERAGSYELDSLDRVELLMECEVGFDIDVADDDADKLRTVAAIAAYVVEKKGWDHV